MKINQILIINAIKNLNRTSMNKFWGVLGIISSINEPIQSNKIYSIESKFIMEFLDRLFNLDSNQENEYSNSIIYVKFSNVWKEKLISLTLKEKPSLESAAVFYNKFNDYKSPINSSELKEVFLTDCKIKLNGLQDIFSNDPEIEVKVEDYDKKSLLDKLSKSLNIERKENYYLSFESPFIIQSRPSELKRAPFIQTLYSGDKIKELMLLSDTNLEELYPTILNKNEKLEMTTVSGLSDFFEASSSVNLRYSKFIITRFITSLLTKPFVILTGLSGSGKTKLAEAFAKWICSLKEQYRIVPVGADWTNRDPLLGYPNALVENGYRKDEFGVLNLILKANENPHEPYFLILDEMNLSHVERYFADFLSIMESKGEISLHSGKDEWNGVPPSLGFPKNLFIIGTVNIDETTYMFSPKVLDRANVIEFRVTKEEMENYLENNSPLVIENLEGQGSSMASSFIEISKINSLDVAESDELNTVLMCFFTELKKVGAEFGYRSAAEIKRFKTILNKIDSDWTISEIIDVAVMQKLLPKVHGSRRKLEPVLNSLAQLCLTEGQSLEVLEDLKDEINFQDSAKIKYPISLEKILRMKANLINNGFTSYAEA